MIKAKLKKKKKKTILLRISLIDVAWRSVVAGRYQISILTIPLKLTLFSFDFNTKKLKTKFYMNSNGNVFVINSKLMILKISLTFKSILNEKFFFF